MSEPWLPWVELRPSRLQRRLIALALLATALTAALLALAALNDPTAAGIAAAAVATAAAAVAWVAARRSGRPAAELSVDARGRIAWRLAADDDAPILVETVFVSPWLICLRIGRQRLLPVWADALDAAAYRRLAAAGRWLRRCRPEPVGNGGEAA